jgi:multidrug efflux pump subunit AcrB
MATDFYVIVELPTGNSLQASSDRVRLIEELVMALPEEELESFVTRIGHNPFLEIETPNVAALWVSLTPYNTRKRTADEIVEELRARTDSLEGFVDVTYMIETGGPPVGRPVSIGIIAIDDDLRKEVADTVEGFLRNLDGVKDIQRDDIVGKEQVAIKVDHDRLARLGLTVADIAQNVRIAYDGEVVTSVRYGDEDVDFRVMFEPGYRERLDYLYDVPIPNRMGRLIPLKNVATFDIGPGPADFRHYNGERAITISADIDQEVTTSTEASLTLYEHFNLEHDYPGARFIKRGEFMETEESMASLYQTFIIAIIAIYFLLVLLFNSFTQPVMVIIAIPFGMIGVVIAFALHGEPMSFVGMMGVIGLAGVVVNDSLVLVSHINKLRKKEPDTDIRTVVAQGTIDRLRAVILTTMTTVVGLLPLVYGLGGSDPFMSATALALSYGLLFATPLTLVLVPCLFVVRHDIHRWARTLLRRDRT